MNKKLVGSIIAVVAVALLATVVLLAQKDTGQNADTAGDTQNSSNNDSSNSQASDMPAGNNDTPSSSEEEVVAGEITIKDFAFSPASITVKKGTTVVWANKDSVEHTVTGEDGGPDSKLFGKNESYRYTFNETGTFKYFCKPHPSMKGQVIVVD